MPDDYTIWSGELNQYVEIKRLPSGGRIAVCEDGVEYSSVELSRFTAVKAELPIEAHLLKKVFDGEVCHVGVSGHSVQGQSEQVTVGNKMPPAWMRKRYG